MERFPLLVLGTIQLTELEEEEEEEEDQSAESAITTVRVKERPKNKK
jgi:hypothetical protein